MTDPDAAENHESRHLYEEAIKRFQGCLHEAELGERSDPGAMTLATCDRSGRPTARTLLLKQVSQAGLMFFTNKTSTKGRQIEDNPRACAVFHWRSLNQQVIFEGEVSVLSNSESDAYWDTRDRESQISAWASSQSQPLSSRTALRSRVAEIKDRFRDVKVSRPDYWQGYLLRPERIEFWKAGWARLNERESYEIKDGTWIKQLLNP